MPIADAIAPLHRLTFAQSTPDGVLGVELNPLAPTAFVHIRRMMVDPGAVFLEYWGSILGVATLLALAFIAWRVMKILSRPQLRGVPHCRTCNYDLSGTASLSSSLSGSPSGSPSSPVSGSVSVSGSLSLAALSKGEGRGEGSTPPAFPPSSPSVPPSSPSCPECGTPLSPNRIVRGRSTRRRLLPLAIAAVAVFVVTSFLQRPPVSHWPSPTLQRWADDRGFTVPDSMALEVSTVLEIDLATGTRVRTILECAPGFIGFKVSPAGDTIVTGYADYPLFTQYAVATGAELRRVGWAHVPRDHSQSICGFSGDDTSVYLRVSTSETAPTAGIVRWSLVDGSTSNVSEVPVVAAKNTQIPLSLARPAWIIPGKPDLILVAPTTHECFAGVRTITVKGDTGAIRAVIEVPASIGDIIDVAVSADGARVHISGDQAIFIADARTLATIAQFSRPPRTDSAFGRGLSVDATGRLLCQADSPGPPAIYDPATSRLLATLTVPTPLLVPDGVQFSSKADFAATIGWNPGGVAPGGEFLIWNVATLRADAAPPPAPLPSR